MDNNQYQTVYYEERPTKAADFRKIARQRLKGHWWTAILVTFIAAILGGVIVGGASSGFSFNVGGMVPSYPDSYYSDPDYSDPDYSDPNYSDPDSEFGTEDEFVEEDPFLTPEEVEELEYAFKNFDFSLITDSLSEEDSMILSIIFIVFFVTFALALLGSLAFNLFLSSPVKVGYQRFFLEVIDGNEQAIKVNTLFQFFKKNYFKTVKLNFLHTLIGQLALLPMWIGFIGGGLVLYFNFPAMLGGSMEAMVVGLLGFAGLLLLGEIVSLCIVYPITYAYSMAHMIMADYPGVGAIEALRASRQMMKGNKWRLFCLDFSFIGWSLLAGFCTCGLGYYVLTPYQYAARAAFYNEISNRNAHEDVEFPSINPGDYIID